MAMSSSSADVELAEGEDFGPVVSDGDGVLEVGRERTIGRHDAPPVIQGVGIFPTDVDHRLHGKDHALLQCRSTGPGPVVRHLGALVHRGANGVANVLAHNAKTGGVSHLLNGPTDFVQAISNDHLLDAGPERTLGYLEESLGFLANGANTGGVGRIAVVTLDNGATVNRDDVAFLQDVVTRNAVDDHVVGTRADNGRESVVAEEVAARATLFNDGRGNLVEIGRGDTGLDGHTSLFVHLRNDLAGLAHLVQFVG